MKHNFIFPFSIFISLIFSECPVGGATYNVGDVICLEEQNMEFDICYGDYPSDNLQLSHFNGYENGGDYKIIWIEMLATW